MPRWKARTANYRRTKSRQSVLTPRFRNRASQCGMSAPPRRWRWLGTFHLLDRRTIQSHLSATHRSGTHGADVGRRGGRIRGDRNSREDKPAARRCIGGLRTIRGDGRTGERTDVHARESHAALISRPSCSAALRRGVCPGLSRVRGLFRNGAWPRQSTAAWLWRRSRRD